MEKLMGNKRGGKRTNKVELGKLITTQLKVLNSSPEKFIKIPRLFFSSTLPQEDGGIGWILNFKGHNRLVFRKVEAKLIPTVLLEVEINNSDNDVGHGITFVDENLDLVQNGTNFGVFGFSEPDYQDANWANGNNESQVPFFFIDNAQINSMYPDGDHYFLSPETVTYTYSALSNPLSTYDLIKIECEKVQVAQQNIGPLTSSGWIDIPELPILQARAIQTKVIFALPCPPEWNPALKILTQVKNSGLCA